MSPPSSDQPKKAPSPTPAGRLDERTGSSSTRASTHSGALTSSRVTASSSLEPIQTPKYAEQPKDEGAQCDPIDSGEGKASESNSSSILAVVSDGQTISDAGNVQSPSQTARRGSSSTTSTHLTSQRGSPMLLGVGAWVEDTPLGDPEQALELDF